MLELDKNARHTVKVTSYYSASVGYPSYQLSVAGAAPGSVPKLKLASSKKTITVRHGTASNASAYQIAYKKAKGTKWHTVTTVSKKRTISNLKPNTKYAVKARALLTIDSTTYRGPWTSVKKISTKK